MRLCFPSPPSWCFLVSWFAINWLIWNGSLAVATSCPVGVAGATGLVSSSSSSAVDSCPCDYYNNYFLSLCAFIEQEYEKSGYAAATSVVNTTFVSDPSKGCNKQRMICSVSASKPPNTQTGGPADSHHPGSGKSPEDEEWPPFAHAEVEEVFDFARICDGSVDFYYRELDRGEQLSFTVSLRDGEVSCALQSNRICVVAYALSIVYDIEGLMVIRIRRRIYSSGSYVDSLTSFAPFPRQHQPPCVAQKLAEASKPTRSIWLVIGIIFICLLVCLISVCVAVFLVRRARNRRSQSSSDHAAHAIDITMHPIAVMPREGGGSHAVRVRVVSPDQYTGAPGQVVQGIPTETCPFPIFPTCEAAPVGPPPILGSVAQIHSITNPSAPTPTALTTSASASPATPPVSAAYAVPIANPEPSPNPPS